MKTYEEPMIEIIPFEANDVICTSCASGVYVPGNNELELVPAD